MNILISNDGPGAHKFIRLGIARAFSGLGHNVVMWELGTKPVLDVFDEFNPDIFIGQAYNLDRPTITGILERPHLRVVLKAGDWGPLNDPDDQTLKKHIDLKKYPILVASEQEKANVNFLKERTGEPSFLEIHYHEDYINQTHGYWMDNGVQVYSQLSAADLTEFSKGKSDPRFECDICFIGGYWPYKAQVLDKWLLPLVDKFNVKIFGNSEWPTSSYCGFLRPEYTATALASAKICINLHEPHSQNFGYDIIERPFKLLSNKCFVISDHVRGLKNLIPNGIVYALTPEDMNGLIQYYLNNLNDKHIKQEVEEIKQNGYQTVIQNHTYLHRAVQILERLELHEEAGKAKERMNKILCQYL